MKLFVLSLALSLSTAAVSAQSTLPTPPATAPPSDANYLSKRGIDTATPQLPAESTTSGAPGITANTSTSVAPAPAPSAAPAKPQIQASAPPRSFDARIESRPVDSTIVGEVHCRPLYISTIHLPEAVTSIAVGAPTLFTAEHVENEPKLVYVSPLTHREQSAGRPGQW
jgi:hypothetical protein